MLAVALATRLDGRVVRPFSGSTGAELLNAGACRDVAELVKIGSTAIEKAVLSEPGTSPIVLDRGWMTVASFVPESADFFAQWNIWVPTTLCWADMKTTLSRLAKRRDEKAESLDWHQHYIAIYLGLAKRSGSPILRTDSLDCATCIEQLVTWVASRPQKPNFIAGSNAITL